MFINKDNILDLIYIKFINTNFMGGGKQYLAPHIFEWGGGGVRYPRPPPVSTPLPIGITYLTYFTINKCIYKILYYYINYFIIY